MYALNCAALKVCRKHQSHRNGVSLTAKGTHHFACPQGEEVFRPPTLINGRSPEQAITEGSSGS